MSRNLWFCLAIFSVLLTPNIVHGLLVTGKCPKVPTTHLLPPLSGGFEPVMGVPYEPPRKSHFFKEINGQNNRYFDIALNYSGYRLISIIIQTHKNNRTVRTIGKVDWDLLENIASITSQYSLEISGLNETSIVCWNVISESVSVWFDRGFVIIWSCVQISEDLNDQAVLILLVPEQKSNQSIFNYPDLYPGVIKELDEVSRNYLTRSFIDNIKWPTELLDSNKSFIEVFDCPERPPLIFVPYLCLALLLGVFGMGVVFSLKDTFFIKRNQVWPMN